MDLVLIRGLPGSGKSTMAKKQYSWCIHLEADMFFMRDGVYRYEPEKIKEAHEWCQASALIALRSGNSVVVSNTFTRLWEMKPYIEMVTPDVQLQIVTATGSYKNIHGVSDDVVQRMRERWES